MGQRHQIYVKALNPYREAYGIDKDEFKAKYGTGKYTIIAFHNQWLYGGSALLSALNFLEFNDGFTKEQRLGNDDSTKHRGDGNPFHYQGVRYKASRSVKYYEQMVTAIANLLTQNTPFREKGWMGSFIINEDNDSDYRDSYELGDNNDGITLIDTIENKYCFMNIGYKEDDEENHSVSIYEPNVPLTAKQYLEAYYPKSDSATQDDDLDNFKLITRFNRYKLMTKGDVKKMFPKMFKKQTA